MGRREMSFLFLWVLNPALILLYQNCSWDSPVQANEKRTVQEEITSEPPTCALKFRFKSSACIE